ncbi:MAG TPA: glycosyltransferase [Candidatus Paceibacterota bacterium]|nr:glycosyltransferase [Candidatus Paceibacterota bacterium]
MRVLQIGSDRSKRGILFPGTPAFSRQISYADTFGHLDIIGFSLRSDGTVEYKERNLSVYPTNSLSKIFYGLDTLLIVRNLPKPDVISAQDPFEVGLLALLIAWVKGVPLHVQVHTDFLSHGYTQHSFMNRHRALVAGFVLRRATRIRVVSERVKNEIIARYKLKIPISVLPIFVDIILHQRQSDPMLVSAFSRFDRKLLFVGRLEPEKNASLAIRAFAQAAPERTCLIIVGDGSERAKLKALAKELNVDAGSRMVIFEDQKESLKYYPIEDLVLVTSHYEGYGLVIIEALAAGKPVISTDVGIAREVGAIIASEKDFPAALSEWFKNGPREMHLKNYPYQSEADYIQKYCVDITACVKR